MTMACVAAYFYLSPFLIEYKKTVDYQAYQTSNLLEGIDLKPVPRPEG